MYLKGWQTSLDDKEEFKIRGYLGQKWPFSNNSSKTTSNCSFEQTINRHSWSWIFTLWMQQYGHDSRGLEQHLGFWTFNSAEWKLIWSYPPNSFLTNDNPFTSSDVQGRGRPTMTRPDPTMTQADPVLWSACLIGQGRPPRETLTRPDRPGSGGTVALCPHLGKMGV